MAKMIATETEVGLVELLDFVRTRHQWILATTRSDGRPQMSPVTGGVDGAGRGAVADEEHPGLFEGLAARRQPPGQAAGGDVEDARRLGVAEAVAQGVEVVVVVVGVDPAPGEHPGGGGEDEAGGALQASGRAEVMVRGWDVSALKVAPSEKITPSPPEKYSAPLVRNWAFGPTTTPLGLKNQKSAPTGMLLVASSAKLISPFRVEASAPVTRPMTRLTPSGRPKITVPIFSVPPTIVVSTEKRSKL